MSDETVALHGAQRTLLWTLAMHARDAASSRPILGDGFAADLLARLGRPPGAGWTLDGNTPVVCTRAKLLDDLAAAFLARHDEAVVLHLGCGLDSRVLRLDPGPGVRWFDVDQEPVIALRRRLYPEREHARTIAASVTDTAWWAQIPDDRPRLVLAEGLLMYLDPEGVRAAVASALAPGGTLVADTVAPWVPWLARWQPQARAAGTAFHSTSADLTTAASSCTLRDETSLIDATADRTGWATSLPLRGFALLPVGRDSWVLRTYER